MRATVLPRVLKFGGIEAVDRTQDGAGILGKDFRETSKQDIARLVERIEHMERFDLPLCTMEPLINLDLSISCS